jgi:hypothetical protein
MSIVVKSKHNWMYKKNKIEFTNLTWNHFFFSNNLLYVSILNPPKKALKENSSYAFQPWQL